MRPARLLLQPEQKLLSATTKEMTLQAQILGSQHAPLSDRKMVIKSPSAKLKTGLPKDLDDIQIQLAPIWMHKFH